LLEYTYAQDFVLIAREEFQLSQMDGQRDFCTTAVWKRTIRRPSVLQHRLCLFLIRSLRQLDGMRHALCACRWDTLRQRATSCRRNYILSTTAEFCLFPIMVWAIS